MNRRELIRFLATGAIATASNRFLDKLTAAENPVQKVRVIIVGAGLAGLVAAYELEQRGHDVVILEADAGHIGGRVRTLRLGDGMYAEAGAMRIPAAHKITRCYIRKFGLNVRPFVQSNDDGFYHLRGQRNRRRDLAATRRLFNLTVAEADKAPDDLWRETVGVALGGLSSEERVDLCSVSPVTRTVRQLDQLSLQQFCESKGLSAEAIELLLVTSAVDTLAQSAVTEHIRDDLDDIWNREFDEIIGGNDLLPAAFGARIRSKPRFGCQVVSLLQDPPNRRVAVVYRERGHNKREEADFVLCTVPYSVLESMHVDPQFSAPKRRAIRQLSYQSATQIFSSL